MQESLFPAMIDAENDAVSNGKIKITEVNSLKVRTVDDATSLFDGFASMKAITWSYDLPMVVKRSWTSRYGFRLWLLLLPRLNL